MPNPKNYMDDKHSYVRGYVRRKHLDPELSPEDLEYIAKYEARRLKLTIASWGIHSIALIMTAVLAIIFEKNPKLVEWMFWCFGLFLILLFLLAARIIHWRNNR